MEWIRAYGAFLLDSTVVPMSQQGSVRVSFWPVECAWASCVAAAIAWEDNSNRVLPGSERRAFKSSVAELRRIP